MKTTTINAANFADMYGLKLDISFPPDAAPVSVSHGITFLFTETKRSDVMDCFLFWTNEARANGKLVIQHPKSRIKREDIDMKFEVTLPVPAKKGSELFNSSPITDNRDLTYQGPDGNMHYAVWGEPTTVLAGSPMEKMMTAKMLEDLSRGTS